MKFGYARVSTRDQNLESIHFHRFILSGRAIYQDTEPHGLSQQRESNKSMIAV